MAGMSSYVEGHLDCQDSWFELFEFGSFKFGSFKFGSFKFGSFVCLFRIKSTEHHTLLRYSGDSLRGWKRRNSIPLTSLP